MTDPYLSHTLRVLMGARQDLRAQGFHLAENERALVLWLVRHGLVEYSDLLSHAPRNNDLLEWLAAPSREVPGLSRIELAIWDGNRSHRRFWPMPASARLYRQWLRMFWPGEEMGLPGRDAFGPGGARDRSEAARREVRNRPFGVNLVGYATYALGIGEDVRSTYLALGEAGIPTALIGFDPGDIDHRRDFSLAGEVADEAPYAISVVCMTAEETARYWLDGGALTLEGTYVVGYWPWELPRWPEQWREIVDLVDEIWVASRHIADAVRPSLMELGTPEKPLHILPLCVDEPEGIVPPDAESRAATRHRFGLDPDATQFLVSFDLNSSIHRKNPWGALAAFRDAFPLERGPDGGDRVGLVIKTFPPNGPDPEWARLKQEVADDPRIVVIEANLGRPDLLALYGACDVYLSLHRAEGFGRCLAECLQLGLDVIATDWSGNTDFCHGPLAHPVGYELVPLSEGQYVHWQDQVWAEPDASDAVARIREVHGERLRAPGERRAFAGRYRDMFSASARSRDYRARLEAIRASTEKAAGQG